MRLTAYCACVGHRGVSVMRIAQEVKLKMKMETTTDINIKIGTRTKMKNMTEFNIACLSVFDELNADYVTGCLLICSSKAIPLAHYRSFLFANGLDRDTEIEMSFTLPLRTKHRHGGILICDCYLFVPSLQSQTKKRNICDGADNKLGSHHCSSTLSNVRCATLQR